MLTKKLKLNFNLLLIMLLLSAVAIGQTTLSGKVLNEKGEGLPAVTITAKGTSSSAISDNNGNFNLAIPQGVKFIIVSSFKPQINTES